MRSISERIKKLEGRPQNYIPKFIIEHTDGHREEWRGMDIISRYEGVKCLYYDPEQQSSVDGAALYEAMYGSDGIEVLPMR